MEGRGGREGNGEQAVGGEGVERGGGTTELVVEEQGEGFGGGWGGGRGGGGGLDDKGAGDVVETGEEVAGETEVPSGGGFDVVEFHGEEGGWWWWWRWWVYIYVRT